MSYLWKKVLLGKTLPKQADSESECWFWLLQTVQKLFLNSQWKNISFCFCRVSQGVFFFRILDLPIFNINRFSSISQAKSMLRLSKCFFNETFNYILNILMETVDSSIVYHKKLENVVFNVYFWVLSLKSKVFGQNSPKTSWFRVWMLVLIAQNCTKTFSDLSVKEHPVLFFVGFRKVCFFFRILDLPIFNLNPLSYISHAKSVLRLLNIF